MKEDPLAIAEKIVATHCEQTDVNGEPNVLKLDSLLLLSIARNLESIQVRVFDLEQRSRPY